MPIIHIPREFFNLRGKIDLKILKFETIQLENITVRKEIMAIAFMLIGGQLNAGPMSKFEDKTPQIEMISAIDLFDLERCLTDLDGYPVPFIYRQPDRPDEMNILWVINARTHSRAYLKKMPDGVAVKIWRADGNQVKSCLRTGRRN